METLRNVTTGEFRDAEPNSDEWDELVAQVYDHGGSAKPLWEQTGRHHSNRVTGGDFSQTDYGEEDKPATSGTDPTIRVAFGVEPYLTAGEVEMGISDVKQKDAEIAGHSAAGDEVPQPQKLDTLDSTAERHERAAERLAAPRKKVRKPAASTGAAKASSEGAASGS